MIKHRAYLLLGSNLGDRVTNIDSATERLSERMSITNRSSLYRTQPVSQVRQPDFINQVIEVAVDIEALELLGYCEEIERQLGRKNKGAGTARPIDIDILLYGDHVIDTPRLIVPHPRLCERRFALTPLDEIAPNLVHPVLKVTVAHLLQLCLDRSRVEKLASSSL